MAFSLFSILITALSSYKKKLSSELIYALVEMAVVIDVARSNRCRFSRSTASGRRQDLSVMCVCVVKILQKNLIFQGSPFGFF